MSQETEEDQKNLVLDALKKNGFADKFPASGVLVVCPQDDGSYKLDPFVYVRSTGTIYYESACGSGSTSVGLMVAKETNASVENLRIVQPSGMDLVVSIERSKTEFIQATVDGPIDILFDGKMYLSSKRNDPKIIKAMSHSACAHD